MTVGDRPPVPSLVHISTVVVSLWWRTGWWWIDDLARFPPTYSVVKVDAVAAFSSASSSGVKDFGKEEGANRHDSSDGLCK